MFNVAMGWKKYPDEQEENRENTVCTEYFNLLYLCKLIGYVPFDLHFVEARHRYTMVFYFMNARSYHANTNCIVPETVNTIDLFNNTVGNSEMENPDFFFLGKYH